MVIDANSWMSKLIGVKNWLAIIYTAETLSILIRKCIQILKCEYTILEDQQILNRVEAFERVSNEKMESEFTYTAVISRKNANGHRAQTRVPDLDDILTFENYLKLKRNASEEHAA